MAKALPVSVDVQSVTDGVRFGQPDTGRRGEYSVWGLKAAVFAPASLPVCGCPGKRRRNVCHHRRTAYCRKRVHRGQRGIIRSATPERFTAPFPGDTASDHKNSGGGGTISGTGALGRTASR
ncbi:hypothetical protein KCP73_04795 [Salmonella enterica subsp. enterica]|nr:hypothetical protein KCP73_04795 [Salmonella enterica subsp. enterica]